MLSDLRARSLPPLRHRFRLLPSALGAGLLTAPLLLAAAPAPAQQAGYGQTLGTSPMERQMYEGGTGRPNSGSILDSTNPIDLMNKLRRSSAMDEATPPASAIDQALQQLDAQAAPTGPVSGAPARPAGTPPLGSLTAPPAAVAPAQPGSTPLNPPL